MIDHRDKIVYLACIERVYVGVLRSQVVKQLLAVKASAPKIEITLVSLTPVHHFLKHLKFRKKLKTEFSQRGLRYIAIPIVFLSRHKYIRRPLLPLFLIQTVPIMLVVSLLYRPSIIHARSYPAALVGLFIKRCLSIKLIFDMRGLYVDEALLLEAFARDSSDEKRWRKLETRLVQKADAVIGVSRGFKEILAHRLDADRFSVVPCSVDLAEFHPDDLQAQKSKEQHELTGHFVVIYSGSIGAWSSIDSIFKMFEGIRRVKKNAYLLLLTQTPDLPFGSISNDLTDMDYSVQNLPPDEVAKALRIADIALLPRKESIVNQVAFPVKFGEYLAAGVPVVVTQSVFELAELVRKHGCGIVVENEFDPSLGEKVRGVCRQRQSFQANGLRFAEENLSMQVCAERILGIYEKLAKEQISL